MLSSSGAGGMEIVGAESDLKGEREREREIAYQE